MANKQIGVREATTLLILIVNACWYIKFLKGKS